MNPSQLLSFSSFRSVAAALTVGVALLAQSPDGAVASPWNGDPSLAVDARAHAAPLASLSADAIFDRSPDGRLWALGATYKASFGADGFVYVPFFGSDAARNYPLQFVLRTVRVGGRRLALPEQAVVERDGARVTLSRGPVLEIYDLAGDSVEQSFVVDTDLDGDVEIEVALATELVEDAAAPGLQFGNHLGAVDYGTAYLVTADGKQEIPSALDGDTLRLRVPAAQRTPGPVVVDPILRTRSLTATLANSDIPDVAYDATTDRWAVTWVHMFSQTDHDVLVELRTGDNVAVAGSFRPIEISAASFSWPRIANVNAADRFLVAMERHLPSAPTGQQYSVWSRTVDAASPVATGVLTQVSPPGTQDQRSADVGGDSGTGTRWTVVWVHGTDIHARQIDANGVPLPNTIPIETGSSPCINPQISLSNGNGFVGTPAWCIVYSLQVSASNWDVYGALLDVSGNITRVHSAISTGAANDLYTYVSSPMTENPALPAFLVSYERQTNPPEMVVRLVGPQFQTLVPETNLTRNFGFSGIYCRVESDGTRFAATCQSGGQMRVGTFAAVNGGLVLHEPPQAIGSGASAHLASKRSGGGPSADYGVAYMRSNSTPTGISLCTYEGRAPSGGLSWRSTGCGLALDHSGEPYLGRTMQFAVANPGSDVAGVALGLPSTTNAPCSQCQMGLDLQVPILWNLASLQFTVPARADIVGLQLAVQAFAIGSGPCQPFGLRLSETIDMTIQ